jgi:hypothetical protein
MATQARESVHTQHSSRRLIVRSVAGAGLALLVGVLVGVLWRERGWPYRFDASLAGFFLIMAIVQGVFMPTRRPRAHTVLFAFVVSAAAWLAVHFLNAALQAAR